MQAAKSYGYTPTEFDRLDMWAAAEVVAAYLTEGRLEAVTMHRSRQQSQQGQEQDPFSKDPNWD